MSETKAMRDFRTAVLTGLTELKTEMGNVVARLDKLNGSVARHESDLNSLKIADAKHEAVLFTITALQTDLEKLKASTLATDTKIALTEKYAKQIWAGVGGSVILLFQHVPQLLKLVEQK